MGWLETIGNWAGTAGGVAESVGQIAQPFLSWYGYEQNKDAISNYQDALQQGVQQGQQSIGQGIEAVKPFSDIAQKGFGTAYDWIMDPSQYEESPGVDWLREQGMQGIERSAAARGGLESGRTLKELSRYNQGLALQDYHGQIQNLTNLAAYANLPTLASLYGDEASLGMYGAGVEGVGDLAGNQSKMDFLYDLLGISQGQGQQGAQIPGGGLAQNVGGLASIGKGVHGLGKTLGLWGAGGTAAGEAISTGGSAIGESTLAKLFAQPAHGELVPGTMTGDWLAGDVVSGGLAAGGGAAAGGLPIAGGAGAWDVTPAAYEALAGGGAGATGTAGAGAFGTSLGPAASTAAFFAPFAAFLAAGSLFGQGPLAGEKPPTYENLRTMVDEAKKGETPWFVEDVSELDELAKYSQQHENKEEQIPQGEPGTKEREMWEKAVRLAATYGPTPLVDKTGSINADINW